MRLKSPKLFLLLSAIIVITGANLFFVSPNAVTKITPSNTDVSTCRKCHQAITDSFIHTAHYFDSRPADSNSIKGSFEEGKNRYSYNQFMEVAMVKADGKFIQSARI